MLAPRLIERPQESHCIRTVFCTPLQSASIGGQAPAECGGSAARAGNGADDFGVYRLGRVSTRDGLAGVTPAAFAAQVVEVLGDPGSWTACAVRCSASADFTVYRATPRTRDRLCGDGDDLYTSCGHGKDAVINTARWGLGTSGCGADIAVYHAYVIDHEVGRVLGYGHELCPGSRPSGTGDEAAGAGAARLPALSMALLRRQPLLQSARGLPQSDSPAVSRNAGHLLKSSGRNGRE